MLTGQVANAGATKISQSQAEYQSSPKGIRRCDKCLQFQPPAACKIVEGTISPAGSCDYFAPVPK
jgi:hypothetical protein